MGILKKLGFLSAFIIPFLVWWGQQMGGAWNLSAFVFAYFLVPMLDLLVGRDASNVAEHEVSRLMQTSYFTWILYALTWTQVGMVVWTAYWLATQPFEWTEALLYTLSFMTISSNGINIAHELGHRQDALSRFHAHILLLTCCYMHFYIEHNRGHHVHVGTPLDPATSKKNQTFYAFWVQTVFGSWKSAWQIEATRIKRNNKPFWQNMMLWYSLMPLFFCGLVAFWATATFATTAWPFFAFFFGQSFLAFSSLEAVNYIEHYGLQRKELSPGRYERVNTMHSWNANHLISNLLLFQLQRHSDHHAYSAKPYQVLKHVEESPQLPAGYPVMILMALVPPLWFSVMNKRLEAWAVTNS